LRHPHMCKTCADSCPPSVPYHTCVVWNSYDPSFDAFPPSLFRPPFKTLHPTPRVNDAGCRLGIVFMFKEPVIRRRYEYRQIHHQGRPCTTSTSLSRARQPAQDPPKIWPSLWPGRPSKHGLWISCQAEVAYTAQLNLSSREPHLPPRSLLLPPQARLLPPSPEPTPGSRWHQAPGGCPHS